MLSGFPVALQRIGVRFLGISSAGDWSFVTPAYQRQRLRAASSLQMGQDS
jgi:hypothetical protein